MATKRVRMLVSMASPEQSFDVGQVYEFEAEEAERLIKAGFAQEIEETEVETASIQPKEMAAQRTKSKKG